MLYVHIPFCARKCCYCDFLSGTFSKEERHRYLQALFREIEGRESEMTGRGISSLFLGGGTPSLLEVEEMAELMGVLRKQAVFLPGAEITVECNPGTANLDKLKGYRELGINRLSMGVQSADDAELRLLGRIHTWEDFLETYEQANEAGFANLNLDLMSGLPGQRMESFENTLKAILALSPLPQHLSVYSLILEEGTPFADMERMGKFHGQLELPSEELDREMYHRTIEVLGAAGYEQYEISNYAREGYACRHNCGYWMRRDYLGFGIGAASLMGDTRYQNTDSFPEYLQDPLGGRMAQKLSEQEEMEEMMFLGLRMRRGVQKDLFLQRFGRSMDALYGSVIEKNCRDGLLMDDGTAIWLTQRGMDLSNYVMAQFLFDK